MTYPERLIRSFRQLSSIVLSRESVRSTLDLVCDLAVETIPVCDVASVSLVRTDGISTVGMSDDVATTLDSIQYDTGQGPCLDAIGKDSMWFQIDDMGDDTSWPEFSGRAAGRGFASLLAFTLKVDVDTLGALNLYARASHVYGEEDRDFGAIYAAHAAVALSNAQAWMEHPITSIGQGPDVSQEIVARAVGILMEREFRSSDEALSLLHERSEQLRVRLTTTAQEVVDRSDQERSELSLPEGFTQRVLGRARSEDPRGIPPPS